MSRSRVVRSNGNMNLHVREWGDPGGIPILLIHGWSQSYMSWRRQYTGSLGSEFRLVAPDLRGHGMSDMPLAPESYTSERPWADDIHAVIQDLDLHRPVLVGWSYGGYVIGDYVRTYGQSSIRGINYVAGAVRLEKAAFGTLIGPGFLDHVEGATKPDLPENIETMRRFLRTCAETTVDQEEFERTLAFNMVVAPQVRAALLSRTIDSDDVLEKMEVPVMVTHGREDRIILPAMSEHILATCPTATASWYEGVGHMAFIEDAVRFDAELGDFARQLQ